MRALTTVTPTYTMYMHIARYTVTDSHIIAPYAKRDSSGNNRNDDIWILAKVIDKIHFEL